MSATRSSWIAGILVATLLLVALPAADTRASLTPAEQHRVFLPSVPLAQPMLRLSSLYYDTETSGEPDEAFRVWNISGRTLDLDGYGVSDGSRTVVFPSLELPADTGIWCTGDALAFARSFGFSPGCEYGADNDPTVPNLSGPTLRFGNNGGQALLLGRAGQRIDAVVYEGGDATQAGWQGPAVEPYTPSTAYGAEGQILYRKFDWQTGQPLPDSDTRGDWAQDPNDHIDGRRVQYPGWDLDAFARPTTLNADGEFTVALGPDNLFDAVNGAFTGAQHSIRIEGYTFEHLALGQTLAARAAQGVDVTLLLEGGPPGGISDQQRYITQLIEDAGGQVWFMVSDRNGADDRYANQHAKFAIIDDQLALISSENFSGDSMPDDDKSDGTLGRRGSALLTTAPPVVAHLQALYAADFDPQHHLDLFRWSAADPKYGAPPVGFVPSAETGGTGYQPLYAQPLTFSGALTAEVVHSPETSLLPVDQGGLLGMVDRAGAGDTVLVEQLYERVHWGGSNDTPQSAPNLRLQAYIDAARRGATVRILLDAYFDTGDNAETVAYISQIVQNEGINLRALLGNPTGRGIHNKMILVEAGGEKWTHLGSINGSEASSKANRELAIQVQSDAVYAYFAPAFWVDWTSSGGLCCSDAAFIE
ncbi:MAG: hypothetical protein H6647_18960 [Anaerolineales bacterium]|nr:hypothetical protein [Anaerolineales bacterium]